MINNHYKWLETNLPVFFKNIGLDNYIKCCNSIISADGDKCYNYEYKWKQEGIPFSHGVALYLITKISPYDKEVRQTLNGWVYPDQWVSENYNKFKKYLPKID